MSKKRRKRDTGIATIKSKDSTGRVTEFKMEEAVRDVLAKKDWTQPPDLPTGPNYDTMTTSELAAARYSGFRINKLALRVEAWVLGEVRGHRRLQDVVRNPAVLASLHEEVFATLGTVIEIEANVKLNS